MSIEKTNCYTEVNSCIFVVLFAMIAFQLKTNIVAIATIFCLSGAFSTSVDIGDANINQLTLIGTVDGKSYFAEGNTTMTWQEAKTFCYASGMQLATVTSVAQQTLLRNTSNFTFSESHWTAGRDAGTPSQYVWDSNKLALSSTNVTPFVSNSGLLSCVVFEPGSKTFVGLLCSNKRRILCELNHG